MTAIKKQKNSAWRMVFTVLLCMAMFFACTGNGNTEGSREKKVIETEDNGKFGKFASEGLSAELEKQILEDYFHKFHESQWTYHGLTIDKFFDDYYISGYFGTYNEHIVVDISCKNIIVTASLGPPPIKKILDWIIFQFPGLETITWKNGQINSVEELYNNGNLSLDDLRCIANLHPAWVEINK